MINGVDDLVTQSRVVEIAGQAVKNKIDINGDKIPSNDYLNWRYGLSILFNYCPDCGKRIDWKEIRKGVQ